MRDSYNLTSFGGKRVSVRCVVGSDVAGGTEFVFSTIGVGVMDVCGIFGQILQAMRLGHRGSQL